MPSHDQAWLETRLADISALLQRSLADIDPTASLAALDRRLDLFERRLDGALSDMAPGADHAGLKLIDAHVMELAEHFENVGRSLAKSVTAYNSAVGTLESRVLVTARRLKDNGIAATGELPDLETIDQTPRALGAPELTGLFDEVETQDLRLKAQDGSGQQTAYASAMSQSEP